jgi:hypothetical protein
VATRIFSAMLLLEGHFYIYIKERDTFRSGTLAGKIGVRFNSQSCHSRAQAVAFDFRYVAVLKSRMFRLSRVSSALFFLEPADIFASRILVPQKSPLLFFFWLLLILLQVKCVALPGFLLLFFPFGP